MRIEIDWNSFHSRYFMDNMIYVKEHENSFEFYTADGVFEIHCVKMKSENDEENIIFVERYMTDKKNMIKVLNFGDILIEIDEPEEEEKEFSEVIENDI